MSKNTYLILMFSFISSILLGQNFTQITTGDIVNDGGWNYACCWADFNGDGFDDLFVCNNDSDNGKHNFLYFNNEDGTFTKITEGEIITDGNSSYGCSAADYDNDGDIDLFVSNYNENNALYNNNGDGTFTKITTGNIVSDMGKSTGCEWADYDKDGWLDIFICNRDEPNFLYHHNWDGTFIRITTGSIVTESKNSGNCVWADFNDDNYPDLYVTNSGPDYNSLFLNNGDGTFTQITDDPSVIDLENFDIVTCGDYDNDGDIDIYTAPGMLPASAYDLYLYQNNGDGTFIRVTGLPHSGINSGGGCSMIDYDNDGDLDIFHTAYDGNNIILQNAYATGYFSQITTGILATDGNYNKEPSWTDFDLDGDIDVFLAVNNYFGGNNKFFTNDGNANNWISIKCNGLEFVSNLDGIGAKIAVTSIINGQQVTQTSTVSCRNSLIAHFGLSDGIGAIIDEIVVQWPSGREMYLTDIAVNQLLEINEVGFLPPNNVEIDHWIGLLTWEPPTILYSPELIGYNLYLDGVFVCFTNELEYQYIGLVLGQEYTAGVSAFYDDPGESEIIEIDFMYSFPDPLCPSNLIASIVDYNDVHLEWDPPLGTCAILFHHDGYDNNGIGTGAAADFICAARFDATDLIYLYGSNLTSVNIHIRTPDFSYIAVKIWEGGSFGNPGTEVYSADITGSVLIEDWTEHILTTPVPLVAGNEYWIGYDMSATGDHPASIDAGPAAAGKGDWIYYSGIWQELSVAFGLDYNWCIEGVVSVVDEIHMITRVAKNTVHAPRLRSMMTSETPKVLTTHPRTKRIENNKDSRLFQGYNVYRDGDVIDFIDDPYLLTYGDLGLDCATYEYWVTAIWDVGESYPTNVEEVTVVLNPPQNFNAIVQGVNNVFCSWDPPDSLFNRGLDSYNIYRNSEQVASGIIENFYLDIGVPAGTYDYTATAVYDGGWESEFSNNATVTVDAEDILNPVITGLIGNFPNPFNPTTTIYFTTENTEKNTELVIYNLKGQKVKTLINERLATGHHSIVWNGRNDNGKPVSSGIYFYKLKTGNYEKTKRMILLK